MEAFFFNDTAATEIYTLSLHDALPILPIVENKELTELLTKVDVGDNVPAELYDAVASVLAYVLDRKSTRLNSSHANISHAVFCLHNSYRRCMHVPLHQRSLYPSAPIPP